jgi:Tol biopolymer transport system component
MRRQDATISQNGMLFLSVVLMFFVLQSLTACGTLEIGVERTSVLDDAVAATAAVLGTDSTPDQAAIAMTEEGDTQTVTPATREVIPETREFTPVPEKTAATPTLAPTPIPSPSALHVVYLKDSEIWLWVEGQDAIPLTTEGIAGSLNLSDDGAMVAFVRSDASLWVVKSDGTGERQLVSADDFAAMEPIDPGVVLHRFDWVPGTHVLAFNTRLQTQVGSTLNDDLRLVDADTLEQTVLLPHGEGGEFTYSPDGRQIAVTAPSSISLIDADGGNRRSVLSYMPVTTYSQVQYYARPVWSADSSALRVAIPAPDPQAEPAPPTSIWHIPADGASARMMGSIAALPIVRPVFSPDLSHVAYLAGQQSLFITNLDTGQTISYQSGVSDIGGWSSDSQHFCFLTFPGGQPQTQIGRLGFPAVPADEDAGISAVDPAWVGAYHYLFLANGPQGWGIRLGEVGGASRTLVAVDGHLPYDFAGRMSPAVPTVVSTSAPTSTPTSMPTPVLTTTSILSQANPVVQSLGIQDMAGRVHAVSADGQYLLFESTAIDLVDRPMAPDIPRVYLYDWEADEITLVSATPGGAPADHWSTDSALSADGSTVAFWSFAGNLAGEGVQDCPDADPGEPCGSLYIYDVDTRALERIPVGAGYGLGMANATALSADGRYVAFATNGGAIWEGTMLLDRETGEIAQISTTGLAVDLSADGRYVAFASDESDLVPDDTDGALDVFVLDRETGAVERISAPLGDEESDQPSGVVPGTEGVSAAIDISPDGRYVVFVSGAPNLVDAALAPCKLHPWEELPACQHVYLRDRETGVTELVSLSDDDEPGDAISSGGSVSADGRWVAFISYAGNLTPEGPIKSGGYRLSGNGPGVFVRDRQEGRTYLVSVAPDGQLPNDASLTARITADGRYVGFLSFADNLVPGVEGGLFVADLHVLVGEE